MGLLSIPYQSKSKLWIAIFSGMEFDIYAFYLAITSQFWINTKMNYH